MRRAPRTSPPFVWAVICFRALDSLWTEHKDAEARHRWLMGQRTRRTRPTDLLARRVPLSQKRRPL